MSNIESFKREFEKLIENHERVNIKVETFDFNTKTISNPLLEAIKKFEDSAKITLNSSQKILVLMYENERIYGVNEYSTSNIRFLLECAKQKQPSNMFQTLNILKGRHLISQNYNNHKFHLSKQGIKIVETNFKDYKKIIAKNKDN